MTITKKQANKLRGKLINLLDASIEYGGAEANSENEYHALEEYLIFKRDFLDEIKNITEPSK